MTAKKNGLRVATAYDFGERPLVERTKFTITFTNNSFDQKFDVFNADLVKGDHFSVSRNTCHTLLPSEGCTVSIYAEPQAPIKYQDLMTFEINGKTAGSYVVASAVGQHRFKEDRGSRWEMRGWMKGRNGFSNSITADVNATEIVTLTRNKYLVDPKNVSVTYRAAGTESWLLFLNINHKGLFGDGPSLIPMKTLAGTDNEWVTKTFEIEEPGTYQASISRGFFTTARPGAGYSAEISNICFNDCAD